MIKQTISLLRKLKKKEKNKQEQILNEFMMKYGYAISVYDLKITNETKYVLHIWH